MTSNVDDQDRAPQRPHRVQDPYSRLVWAFMHEIESPELLRGIRYYADNEVGREAEAPDIFAFLAALARGDQDGAHLVVEWLQQGSLVPLLAGLAHKLGLAVYGSTEAWTEALSKAAATGELELPA